MVAINSETSTSNLVEMGSSATDSNDTSKVTQSASVDSVNNKASIMKKKKDKAAARLIRKQEKMAAKKGMHHSGRWWKDPEIKKFSSIFNPDTRAKNNLQRAKSLKNERKIILQRKEDIHAEQKARKEHIKERKKINEERTLENQRKSERVQIIKNSRSIKKMKKKQLRQIETRDLNALTSKNIQG